MLNIKLPDSIPALEVKGNRNISILRISCGDKFYIAKTANPEWVVKEIKSTYARYVHKGGIPENNLFYPLLKHAWSNDISKMRIEILFTSTNGYQVLKYELEQLMQYFGTKDCLNHNNIPHIPKTVSMLKGSNWLTQNQALNFRKLLTKYNY